MPTRLYLCRHGQVQGDGQRRYNGHKDVDINETGVMQMEGLRDRLKDVPLSAIFCSDLIRTVRGAEIIGGPHAAPRFKMPQFRERGVGAWEGLSWDEIQARYPGEWAEWLGDIVHFVPPGGGESLLTVSKRVMPALHGVIGENQGKEIALVAHGGVNRVILADALGLDLKHVFRIEQCYGALNVIDYYKDGIPVVKLLNG